MKQSFEEILSDCIDRLIAGASLQDVLAEHPQHAAALAPVLRGAHTLLHAGTPMMDASPAARDEARQRLVDRLAAPAPDVRPEVVAPIAPSAAAPRETWLDAFMRRPAAFRAAAVAGSIALFGALGIGAAAATGNTPEPVRELFRSSATSGLRVEFEGVIMAIDPAASTLDVAIGDDVRVVRIVDSTELSRGSDAIAFADFTVGAPVEVKGALQPDDTIIAARVHLEDADDGDGDATPEATPDADEDEDANDGDDGDDAVDDHEGDDDADVDEADDDEADDDLDEHEDNAGPGEDIEDDGDLSGDGEDIEDDGDLSGGGEDIEDDGDLSGSGEDSSGSGGDDDDAEEEDD